MQAVYEIYRDNINHIAYMQGKNICIPHFHQQIEIVYVNSGSTQYTVNTRTETLSAGQLMIADSFDIHIFPNSDNCISSVLIVPFMYLGAYHDLKRGRTLKDNFIKDTAAASEIYTVMQKVKEKRDADWLLLSGLVNTILGMIVEHLGFVDDTKNADFDLVRRVLIYIEENYANPLTLNSLALNFGYSPYHFSRLIKRYLGCSVPEYINNVRLKRAAGVLSDNPKAKLTDVALSSGFNSLQTFHRCFKQKFGKSPGSFSAK